MGWTWLEGPAYEEAFKAFPDDGAREIEVDRRWSRIDEIAKRISAIKRDGEQETFIQQSRMEDDRDSYDPGEEAYENYNGSEPFDSAEWEAAASRAAVEAMEKQQLQKRVKEAQKEAELEVLEDELARLGARMARPYEHWNEDEKLMEYLERDR